MDGSWAENEKILNFRNSKSLNLCIIQLITIEAMSSYEGKFFKVGVFSTRFISETKSVIPQFIAFLT